MARVGAGEWLSDNDVAWLCILHGYLIEAIDLHIGEIEIFSPQPPSVSPPEVRQVDAAKMICVPEKRVAIHNAVVEPAPQQEWHRPVFPQLPARCKPPWQSRHYLHLPVSTRKRWLALRVRMKNRCNLSFILCCKPVIVTYTEVMPGLRMHIQTAKHSLIIQDQRAHFILRRGRIVE